MWKKKSTSQLSGQVCLPRKAGFITLKGVQISHRKGTLRYAGVCSIYILGVGELYYPCP